MQPIKYAFPSINISFILNENNNVFMHLFIYFLLTKLRGCYLHLIKHILLIDKHHMSTYMHKYMYFGKIPYNNLTDISK